MKGFADSMKRVGIAGTTVLLLLFGATAIGFAQHERQGEKHGKPDQQADAAQQKGKQQGGQKQQQQAKGQQERQRQPQQQQQRGQQHQRAQQQQRRQPAQLRTTPQQQRVWQQQQHGAWQQYRARSWESEHRTWQQRGGYNGYRVPDDYFRVHYGRSHWFRIYMLPFMVVGGYPRFQYGGYWFTFVDPYPEYWGNDWYQSDDVYVDYYGDGYYLYNRRYPGRPGIAISISF